VSVSVFPVTSKPFYIVANYKVFKVLDRMVAPLTFKFEFNIVLLFTVKVPTFEVLPVTRKLLERAVDELIVSYVALTVALADDTVKSPEIVVGPYKS
jgi:hypothetical protein